MATSLITIDISELEAQRRGVSNVSLTDWNVTTVSQYSANSSWEQAGSLYQVVADEDAGTAGEWAAIGVSTLVYSYHNPATLTFYYSSTAPAWDDAKQGHYHTVSTTHRCLASIYKDAAGDYTQKTILLGRDYGMTYTGLNIGGQAANADHITRYATDASISWIEAGSYFALDKETHVAGDIESNSNIIATGYLSGTCKHIGSYIHGNAETENTVFDALSPTYLVNVNDEILVSGTMLHGGNLYFISRAKLTAANTVTLYGYCYDTALPATVTCVNGDATAIKISIAW